MLTSRIVYGALHHPTLETVKLNGVTNVVGSDDVMRSLCDSDAKLSCFMNCVYWGRLVENLFCVVSIENGG